MSSCYTGAQDADCVLLSTALGVVHATGHVQNVWLLKPYTFLLALVNTNDYMPLTLKWHDLQNKSAPQSTSLVFALFEFQ
jgi:hypothetical protein